MKTVLYLTLLSTANKKVIWRTTQPYSINRAIKRCQDFAHNQKNITKRLPHIEFNRQQLTSCLVPRIPC